MCTSEDKMCKLLDKALKGHGMPFFLDKPLYICLSRQTSERARYAILNGVCDSSISGGFYIGQPAHFTYSIMSC